MTYDHQRNFYYRLKRNYFIAGMFFGGLIVAPGTYLLADWMVKNW